MKKKLRCQIRQAGFTLIETMVVVILIGVLAALVATQVGSAVSTGARSKTLYVSAQKIASAWSMIVMQTGVSSNPDGSPLLANASNKILDAIMMGDNPPGLVASAYSSAFSRVGVKPLGDIAELKTLPTTGTAGEYKIVGYPVTFASGGVGFVKIIYAGTPQELAKEVYETYTGNAFDPATVPPATSKVQYSAPAADGSMTLTIRLSA